jgi:hypothetical protein
MEPVLAVRLHLSRGDRDPRDLLEPMRVERPRDEAAAHEHGFGALVAIEQFRHRLGLDGSDGNARLLTDCQEEGAELGVTDHQPH